MATASWLTPRQFVLLQRAVFLLALLPLLWLIADAVQGHLGANPIESVVRRLGDWALRLLLCCLAMTPLRLLTGQNWPVRLRRMLGLYAFFYALLHVSAWVVLEQFFDVEAMLEDLLKRPYITLGALAFIGLWPLALTSTQGWQRRLGQRWQRLHRLVYPIAILAVLHHFLMVKADLRQPLLHACVLALLFGVRLRAAWQRRCRR